MKLLHTFLLTFVFFTALTFCAKLPPSITKCDYKKIDFNECLKNSMQMVISQLYHPLNSIGLPNVEPLEVSSFSIGAGNGPVGVQENFKDAKLYGFTNGTVENAALNLDTDNMYLNFTLTIPEFKILAKYQMDGKVLLIPVQGRGDAMLLLKNVTGVAHLPLEKSYRKGLPYLKVVGGTVAIPKMDLLYMHFENAFNGNKELSDTMNKVINDNWRDIFNDVRGGYENFFKEIAVNLSNRFFAKVPLTEMVDNFE